MIRLSILCILLIACNSSFAQKENSKIRKGNRSYDAAKYDEAETKYRTSLDINPSSFPANNNLGNAMYRQEKYEEAAKQFLQSSLVGGDKIDQADSYYNYGNALFQGGKLRESIEAYKNALRLNPRDNDARYNLALAQKMKNEQQQNQDQQGENQNKDKQENQKNKENKEQKKEGENQEQDKAQEQQGDKDEQQKEGQQAKQQKISKEDAERMLEALKNQEQDLQKKLARKKGKRINIEKDW